MDIEIITGFAGFQDKPLSFVDQLFSLTSPPVGSPKTDHTQTFKNIRLTR
ncbi:MAG: hypothetical protein L6Q98_22600 [Anaerolineae bacterium]|nr:hypothetical protein [Anaerolineae bacterium]NUQ06094.1 hypothetical protein [Anaerolineae bacterium]